MCLFTYSVWVRVTFVHLDLGPSHVHTRWVFQRESSARIKSPFCQKRAYRHLFISCSAMKEPKRKVNKDRTYDSEGYTRRAGCLCFKTDREEEVRNGKRGSKILLRSSALERNHIGTNSNTCTTWLIWNVIQPNCSITTSSDKTWN